MLLKPKTSERKQAKALLAAATADGHERVVIPLAEMTVWLLRLYAVLAFERTGRSVLLEREARHLGVSCEQLIDLYHNRLSEIKMPKLEVFTDDLL